MKKKFISLIFIYLYIYIFVFKVMSFMISRFLINYHQISFLSPNKFFEKMLMQKNNNRVQYTL